MILKRQLKPFQLLQNSSHFLLGPRAVGKSLLIKTDCLSPSFAHKQEIDFINLLDSRIYLKLKNDPSLLSSMAGKKYVIIDEIQRVPELLNEVHRLIEERGSRFLLTGSSARKLKRGQANLLAGRAFKAALFPLTWFELNAADKFNLNHFLHLGGLPLAYLRKNGQEYLYNYVDTYLKEEIYAEALTRSLPNYTRFLHSAAFNSCRQLNYTKTARDAQLAPNTVRDYYQILEDTLIGFMVPPWTQSIKRKAVQSPKFYFFDPGVVRSIQGIKLLSPKTPSFGLAFEHFIACELRACLSYKKAHLPMSYWRSRRSGLEVDFIIGDQLAIEVKAGKKNSSERSQRPAGLKRGKSLATSPAGIQRPFRGELQQWDPPPPLEAFPKPPVEGGVFPQKSI